MSRSKDALMLYLRHTTRSNQATWYSTMHVNFVALNTSVGKHYKHYPQGYLNQPIHQKWTTYLQEMAMTKFKLTYNGEEKTLQTDDFNEDQNKIFAEASTAERELVRYKYLTAIFEDRRAFLLGKLVESVEAPEVKEEDGKEET